MKVVKKGSEISDRCQVSTFTHVSEPELLTVENQVISIEYFTFNINTSHDPIFFENSRQFYKEFSCTILYFVVDEQN